MAGLRPGRCYRAIERPYTRKSKYKNKSYVKAVPPSKVARFDLGDLKKEFNTSISLLCDRDIQIRGNSIEAARQVVARKLDQSTKPYRFKVRIVPHHAIRENKMLTGAGADRMSTGMQRSFGRIIGTAAQVRKGAPIFTVYMDIADKAVAIEALKSSVAKLPCKSTIEVLEKKV